MSVSAAKSRVMQARSALESGRGDDVAQILQAAEGFLADATPEEKAPILAEIAVLRVQLAATMKPEDRRALSAAQGKIRQARSAVAEENFFGLEETLGAAEKFLATTSPAVSGHADIAAAKAEIGTLRARGRGLKDPAAGSPVVSAAAPAASGGAAPGTSHGVHEAMAVPAAHASASGSEAPRTPVDWEYAAIKERVGAGWGDIYPDIHGWEHEALPLDAGPLDEPLLPLTRAAVVRIGYMLRDPATRANRSDPSFEAAYVASEQQFDAAAAQLANAYHAVLGAAEALPTPGRRADLDRPVQIAASAEIALHGTTYREAVVTRARALGARWQAEHVAIVRPHVAQAEALAREADAAWPLIMQRTDVQPELDPTKLASRGKTILLRGVINRCGWELGGAGYDFAVRAGNAPLAGAFEPHVVAALERAYAAGFEVSDRIAWDVIGVVDGPDTIGERTLVTLEDETTHLEIGVIEEWRRIVCLRLKIIALRAGPVAVGP